MTMQPDNVARTPAVRLLLGLGLALLFLMSGYRLPPAAAAGQPVASGTRIGGDDVRTRFVADLSQAVGYTVYVLPDPYRVMIDLPGVIFDLPPDAGRKTRGLITEYRYGPLEGGRSRIVLDTKGPVLIEKSFIVPPQSGQPARVVVDLVQTSAEAFAAALKSDEKTSMAAIAAAAGSSQTSPADATVTAQSGDAAAEEIPASAPPPSAAGKPATASTADTDQLAALAEAPTPTSAAAVDPPDPLVAPDAEAAVTPVPTPKSGTEQASIAQQPAQPTAKPLRHGSRHLVVIDPGHGGVDPGAIGLSRTLEKDVTLAFGLKLRDILKATGDIDVVMTRSDDTFLTLTDRVKVARDNSADLFIAIHADTVPGQDAHGATIYTLSAKASDAEAEALAHKENRADIIAGVDLEAENQEITGILIDLAQRESKTHSMVFAKKAVSEMKEATGFTGKPMRSAGFVVLKAPDVPSVLIELGYLSSRKDESQLNSPQWQANVAAAMARAVEKYFTQKVAARTN